MRVIERRLRALEAATDRERRERAEMGTMLARLTAEEVAELERLAALAGVSETRRWDLPLLCDEDFIRLRTLIFKARGQDDMLKEEAPWH